MWGPFSPIEIMMYCEASAAHTKFPSQASLSGKSGRDFSKREVIFSDVTLRRKDKIHALVKMGRNDEKGDR